MFRLESYLTPVIEAYLGKYVDNFNAGNFQLSLWQGGATFNNVNLNLIAIEKEFPIPFELHSGHIHEMKINVPWTKITSEPIIVTINTFELSVGPKLRQDTESSEPEVITPQQLNPTLPVDTPGYMEGLMNKIIQNVKFICRNVILKYTEADIVISFNFENVTLFSVNENWEHAFIDISGKDFSMRRKLICPDLTVCLDNPKSISRHTFTEPLLYKCAFDVRIMNKFQGPYSRSPYLRKIDILFNDIDITVMDEQIPMLVRLYHLIIAISQLRYPKQLPEMLEPPNFTSQSEVPKSEPQPEELKSELRLPPEKSKSDLQSVGKSVVPQISQPNDEKEVPSPGEDSSSLYDWAAWAVGWIPVPNILGSEEEERIELPLCEIKVPMLNLGLYIRSTNVTMKTTDRICDKSSTTSSTASSRIKTVPFMKCQIQGIVCDVVEQGVAMSLRGGFSKFTMEGIGYCPCGLNDCIEEPPQFPVNQNYGITYLVVGSVNENFAKGTLFDGNCENIELSTYQCRFHCKGYEDNYPDEAMLERTPGIAIDSVELLSRVSEETKDKCSPCYSSGKTPPDQEDSVIDESSMLKDTVENPRIGSEDPESKTATRIVVAPFRIKVSTGFIHRLKLIVQGRLAYNYDPYQLMMDLEIPVLRCFVKLRMDHFQCIFYDGDTGLIKEAKNQIVMEISGVKTNFDIRTIYAKWYFHLRKLDIRTYRRKLESEDWDLGDCLGVIMSCGDEIQPKIQIAKSSTENSSTDCSTTISTILTSTNRSAPPVNQFWRINETLSRAISRSDYLVTFTYTIVKAANFHANSLHECPTAAWNKVVSEKQGKDSEFLVSPNSEERYFSELDIKLKPMDFILTPTTTVPFISLVKEIISVSLHQRDPPKFLRVNWPKPRENSFWNNINSPLVYLNAGKIRVFLKSSSVDSCDTVLIQIPSLQITSQVENSLHRHYLRSDLYAYAEEANITNTPGALVENRQYELSIHDLSISTVTWMDVEKNSLKLVSNRSINDMISMNKEQKFEPVASGSYQVTAFPLLEKFDINCCFSPAIVFQSPLESKTILIAGYAGEVNFSREIQIIANTQQLALVYAILSDLTMMKYIWENSTNFLPDSIAISPEPTDYENEIPYVVPSEASSLKEVDSGVESSNLPQVPVLNIIPADLFIAATSLRITTYHLISKCSRNSGKSVEQDMDSISGFKPQLMFNVVQPYFVYSTSSISQKIEFSIFDFTVGMGSGVIRSVSSFTTPKKCDFPVKLFETIPGERNPKTGMSRPFLTCTAIDFLVQQLSLSCDIARPIKFVLSKERFQHFKELQRSVSDFLRTSSIEIPKPDRGQEISLPKKLRCVLGYFSTAHLLLNQIMFVVLEEPAGITKAAISLTMTGFECSLRGNNGHTRYPEQTDRATVKFALESLVITTLIGDRTDVLMNPWGMRLRILIEWHNFLNVPVSTLSFNSDPLTIFFGPQNILSFLQVYHTFGEYLMNFIIPEEKLKVELLETSPYTSVTDHHFKNDLRKGTFHFVYSITPSDEPAPYQVFICKTHRTMTWRYPNPRTVESVVSHPVPILESSYTFLKADEPFQLTCKLSFWDEAKGEFVKVGTFNVTESTEHSLVVMRNATETSYISPVWRITILTPLDDEDLKVILTPEGLVGSLSINSYFAPSRIPKLLVAVTLPRISIHFMNHRTYAGKIPEDRLNMYSMTGLSTQVDQSFATLEVTSGTMSVTMWMHRTTAHADGYMRMTVTDYAYLTDISVLDPFHFNFKYSTSEDGSKKIHQELVINSKPIVGKVGASTLHTIISSTMIWMQVLKAYYGDVVDISKNHFQTQVNLSQILVCNDTETDLQLIQTETKKPFPICGRQCFALTWINQKVKQEVRLSCCEEKWNWSSAFPLNRFGTIVRRVGDKDFFITTENLYASQILVTVSGCFSLANALDIPIDVGVLQTNWNKETVWTLQSRTHGPSHQIRGSEVAQLRFKLTDLNCKHHGWSHGITIADLKHAPKQAKCVALYEEEDGRLVSYNIWCTLVEEVVDGVFRTLVVLSPIFRIRSLLSSPIIVSIATAKNDSKVSFELEGRGSEVEVDFLGDDTVAHLLTFQSDSESPASSPAVPLLPGGGPCIENVVHNRSINDIIKDIISDVGQNRELKSKWPFTREGFEVREWNVKTQPEAAGKVTFKSWVPGIPSVLVEAKPDAIFANLTGYRLIFREDEEDVLVLTRSAFSPKNIRGKFSFGFESTLRPNIIYWSEEMKITDNQSRSDVHHINTDWQIPVGCYSRLEINGSNMQIHITIETKLHDGILILTLRPTFNLQNRTKFPLSVCGISLNLHSIPSDDLLCLRGNSISLDSNEESREPTEASFGLLGFSCDRESSVEMDVYKSGMKYIALQYANSPWWFVQLMKFESIFDNLSAPQGIPVKRVATAIPSCQPHWANGKPIDLIEVTLALSICWTCKNGQVWISVAVDENPQVVIFNHSSYSLCYAEAESKGVGPQIEYEHFPQFRCVAPHTTAFYAFPSLQGAFPEVMNSEPKATLVFGSSTLDYKNVRRMTMLCRDSSSIEWSTPAKCEDCDEVQLIHIGTAPSKLYLKVLTEKLGLTYYVYIEQLSEAEVSATDVRARIAQSQVELPSEIQKEVPFDCGATVRFTIPLISQIHLYHPRECNQLLSTEQLMDEIASTNTALQLARPSNSKYKMKMVNLGTKLHPYFNVKIYLPEVRLIFTDDFTHAGQKREIVSLIITDFTMERHPKIGERELRILNHKKAEFWKIILCVGDIQIDNALYQEKRYDFPVLLQRNDPYESNVQEYNLMDNEILSSIINYNVDRPSSLIRIGTEFLITAPAEPQRLHCIDIKCQSFTVNIEDKFISFIFPVFENFATIITERFSLLQAENKILIAQRKENHGRERLALMERSALTLVEKPIKTKVPSLTPHITSKTFVELFSSRKLSLDSSVSSPRGTESPGLLSPSIEDGSDSLRIHHEMVSVLPETYQSLTQRLLYADIGAEYVGKLENSTKDEPEMCRIGEEAISERLLRENSNNRLNNVPIPLEIVSIIQDLANSVQLQKIHIHQVQTYLTFRGRYRGMYFAFDNSPVLLNEYLSNYVLTTKYTLGETFGNHYLMGAVYKAGNSMRLLGSLELLGSPGTLARSLGTGVKDFVVYPVKGIMLGPLAFLNGLNTGCTSLVRNVSSGTLTSVTNFAWSVSRNIDRLTLDQDDEAIIEETRRVPIDGISDGLTHGLTGFGIRLLGAIGGIAQHPIQAMMDNGPSPIGLVTGIGKGLIGAVTKPVGATVELVAMTGQGLLQEAGWVHKFTRKYDVFVEETASCSNSLLKYRWKLGLYDREPGSEKLLLALEAVEEGRNHSLTPVSLVITTENVYIMDTTLDQIRSKESISSSIIKSTEYQSDAHGITEFFNLLKMVKRIHNEHIFGVFDKISTSY